MNKKLCGFILLLICSSVVQAQYFGERVLEKTFEWTDFFFTPVSLTPLGIGSFRSVAIGFFDDDLSWLALNPAYLSDTKRANHYAYVDFRSVSDIRRAKEFVYYPMDLYRTAVDLVWRPYPRYYYETRKELQPIFSAAYLTRPLPSHIPNLTIGITYQTIFQDDRYYPIPQDIYRSVPGFDYAGRTTAAEDLPITDRYKGEDNIHHLAHLVSLFAAYGVTDNLDVGIKVGRTTFDRDGSFGSQNMWDGYYRPSYTSLWGNMESRGQQYRHWDFAVGVRYRDGEHDIIGGTFGYLRGLAAQQLTRTDTSFYGYGTPEVGPSWSYYMRSGITEQTWAHNGRTRYGQFHLTRTLSPSVSLTFVYGFNDQRIDIDLASGISDTSFSSYRYVYRDTIVYRSEGSYHLIDSRTGGGSRSGTGHRFLASVLWKTEEAMSLLIGLQYETQQAETQTSEGVSVHRRSSYWYSGYGYVSEWFDRGFEDKTLKWNFNTRKMTLQIPVLFQWKMAEWLQAMIGASRIMSRWEMEDVTLAIVRVREQTASWGSSRKENFGERYTMPKERVSEVRTSVLAGLTASASRIFSLRLLLTPNVVEDVDGARIQDLRWWLSFQVTP